MNLEFRRVFPLNYLKAIAAKVQPLRPVLTQMCIGMYLPPKSSQVATNSRKLNDMMIIKMIDSTHKNSYEDKSNNRHSHQFEIN